MNVILMSTCRQEIIIACSYVALGANILPEILGFSSDGLSSETSEIVGVRR